MSAAVALLAAFLPTRHWGSFTALPIRRYAAVSAILTLSLGFAFGIGGFMDYSTRVMNAVGKLQIDVAERQLKGELPMAAEVSTSPMGAAMLSPLAFVFFTPLGQLSAYLVLTGFIRALTCVVDDPMGDPVLTAVDGIFNRLTRRGSDSLERRRREKAEGPETPDRLYPGEWAGLADVEFVLVCSRRKPDWDRGTFVITSDKWYVVGEPFDRQFPEGLRAIYPLTEQTDGTVLRRGVHYELPPLQRRRSSGSSTQRSV